jgi:hypothetical protein
MMARFKFSDESINICHRKFSRYISSSPSVCLVRAQSQSPCSGGWSTAHTSKFPSAATGPAMQRLHIRSEAGVLESWVSSTNSAVPFFTCRASSNCRVLSDCCASSVGVQERAENISRGSASISTLTLMDCADTMIGCASMTTRPRGPGTRRVRSMITGWDPETMRDVELRCRSRWAISSSG